MLKIIDSDFIYENRHRFGVNKINGKRDFLDHGFTRFLIFKGTLTSKNTTISGIIAASINEAFTVDGSGIVLDMFGYKLTDQFLSVVQPDVPGNLSYIDGCSNTNLVSPGRNGDPCLNYLFFPKNTNQTFHIHPSVRIGMILSGKGQADLETTNHSLKVGDCFLLERYESHRFCTEDSNMSLIAFHPDSEDGPKDEYNPMKSRTYTPK